MKIQYEDSKYKAKGQSYEQMLEVMKGYANAGEYGCYITTLDDDKALEEYNAKHPICRLTWKHLSVAKQRL